MSAVFRLPYTAPYDWPAIRDYLALRAIPGVEAVAGQVYARTIAPGGRHGLVTVRPGEGDALRVTIRYGDRETVDPEVVPAALARLRRMFDLDADPAAILAGLSRDPYLAALVAARPGLRVPGAWDGFELGVRAILGQQVSVAAATRLAGRLVAAFGAPLKIIDPAVGAGLTDVSLTHVFPTPEALAQADIAAALGMPRARGAAIASLAEAVAADPALFAPGRDPATAVAALTRLRGIGDWTAQYIAMRALRAPDALPAGDIGLLRALDVGAGRPTPKVLLERSQAWRPWRAYAVLHLWASDADGSQAIRQQAPGCAGPGKASG
ncbi:DNA-3-methyladenine glycosylase 2 family protein [Methylobacterium sp. BTF04]|uniref:DNA-3-methyladenine glycosylase family protein n=1 Tax=Methylobacterium sp. BTF04 TaxID=2708300 RepID=UPI0013D11935|nr:DNA-3-methyladenine glycosylase [Methylobacterium sp. BTF04]NEU11351.1 DNA-3-methyladenine glycosylase 2 family protein [Methylobacterium sp. BTF04]